MDIVAYMYRADIFCSDHIVAQVTNNPGDTGHRMATVSDAERHLDLLARIRGIDRQDEYSYDSDDFPKVVFASQLEDTETCSVCGVSL